MSQDYLTQMPTELLRPIIQSLPSLALLRCREVHPRFKILVDTFPEYQLYQKNLKQIIKQYHDDRSYICKRHVYKSHPTWSVTRAAKLFSYVRRGTEVDYYLFQFLLENPQLRSNMSVFSVASQKSKGG